MMGTCSVIYSIACSGVMYVCITFSETFQKRVIMLGKYYEAKAGYNQYVYYDLSYMRFMQIYA